MKKEMTYRCMNCDKPKNDKGAWVVFNDNKKTTVKVCQCCKKHFKKAK